MKHLVAIRTKDGEAICPAGIIENRHIPERRYPVVESIVTLDGQPEPVLKHDYMALLTMSDGQYRPMTISEQTALRKRQEQERTVEE